MRDCRASISIPLRYNLEDQSSFQGMLSGLSISIPLRYNLENLPRPLRICISNFNSTKVQFGGDEKTRQEGERRISIPLRYNLEVQRRAKRRIRAEFQFH